MRSAPTPTESSSIGTAGSAFISHLSLQLLVEEINFFPPPPPFFFFHWEKKIKEKEGGKSIGDSFVKGISIQTAKYQEKSLKKDPLFGDNVSNCLQPGAEALPVASGGWEAVAFSKCLPWGQLTTAQCCQFDIFQVQVLSLCNSVCLLPSQFFPPVLSTAAFAKSNKSHS